MSNINPNNIDGTYPIAGQDNNSQGFRDNFTNTINNFTFAKAELTDLQTYSVLKAPLGSVGQSGTPTNDMNYAYLTKSRLIQSVEVTGPSPTVSGGGAFTVDWNTGHYQEVTIDNKANSTLTFGTWPTTTYWTKLRLKITVSTVTTLLTLPAAVSINISNLQGYTSGTTVSLPVGTYILEFATNDAGATIAVQDVLRNYTPTFIGNLVTNAAHVETGYQQVKPTANVAVTVNHNVNRVLLHPTGTIISFGANVTLPNISVDGTIVNISSNVTIASLDVRSGWNGVVAVSPFGNATSVTAGTNTRYMYINADKVWYKIA